MRILIFLALITSLSSCADYCETYDGYYCEYRVTGPALVSQATQGKTLSGVWNISLDIDNSKCPFLPSKITAPVSLRENGKNISLSIPGKGELRGTINSSRASLRGTFELKPYPCSALVTSNMSQIRRNSARVSAGINMSCNGRPLCSAKGSGNIKR